MSKPHSLVRIKRSLVNVPHLIEPTSFNTIMDYVNSRIAGTADMTAAEMATWDDIDGDYSSRYMPETQTGVMHINGPLSYKTSGWEALCGGTSYEMLKEQMEYFVEAGAKTVIMMADSGGGEAYAMMDSANYIRKLADENGIQIIAYVDGMAASACYGLICIADEIVMSADSQVGSIGVLVQLYNDRKWLEKQGYERQFITAGEDKVPFDEEGAFTKNFIDGIQAQVDKLYEGFTSHVALHRKIIDKAAVKKTEANVYMADEALERGLADKVMTLEEFYDYSAGISQNNLEGDGVTNAFKKAFSMSGRKDEEAEMATVAELTTKMAELEGKLEAQATAAASAATTIQALTEQLKGATEALAAVETEKAEAKTASRRAQLAEVLPEDQVEAKLGAYASLDDATFSFIHGELKATKEARAAGMKAHGSDGEPVVDEDEDEVDPAATLLAAGVAAAKALRG